MYFLTQSFASALLLVCLFSWSSLIKTTALENLRNIYYIISILIALKVAIAPLHFWFIKMSKWISWTIIGLLLTWQKLIPLSFLISFSINIFIPAICIISLLVGTLSQLKLTSLKILIVYSSISHLGWIVIPVSRWSLATLSYLIIYSLILLPLILYFSFLNYQYLFNQIRYKIAIVMAILILSLGGIPPLRGFFLKWICLKLIIQSIIIIIIFSLIACLSFYIYIQIVYKRFLLRPFSLIRGIPLLKWKWVWSFNLFLPILPILY